MKINYQMVPVYAILLALSLFLFMKISESEKNIQPKGIVEYSTILDINGFSPSDKKNIMETESISSNGDIKVKTINHQGRKYDVFYSKTNERFQVIRVPK